MIAIVIIAIVCYYDAQFLEWQQEAIVVVQ